MQEPPDANMTSRAKPLQTRDEDARNDRDCNNGIVEWLICNVEIIILILCACIIVCMFIAGLYVFFRVHDPGRQKDDVEEQLMIPHSKYSEPALSDSIPLQTGERIMQEVVKPSTLKSTWNGDMLSFKIHAPPTAVKQTSRMMRFNSRLPLVRMQDARNYWEPFKPTLGHNSSETARGADDGKYVSTEMMPIRPMEYATTTAQSVFGHRIKPLKKGRVAHTGSRSNTDSTAVNSGHDVTGGSRTGIISQSSHTHVQLEDEWQQQHAGRIATADDVIAAGQYCRETQAERGVSHSDHDDENCMHTATSVPQLTIADMIDSLED
ncbi:hypothetical protein CYMTET_28578 [Cymbomonas tetramitiformis]|uniref:Uncharacterized protein n=1 Tax=Cymbomonas tetramitiformis TaxID=36881 RepID=A0AAE0FMZ6_9CHLO|nr:hypothetical protein CYMTET_28578 [Cymbomonas tetramitiformis]